MSIRRFAFYEKERQYAKALLKDLRNVHLDGLMNRRTFDQWYDRFLGALAEKDSELPPSLPSPPPHKKKKEKGKNYSPV